MTLNFGYINIYTKQLKKEKKKKKKERCFTNRPSLDFDIEGLICHKLTNLKSKTLIAQNKNTGLTKVTFMCVRI
jgi:hypothetical protein